jgi:hypothetical protein
MLRQRLRCTGRSRDGCGHDPHGLGCCQPTARLTHQLQPALAVCLWCCLWLFRAEGMLLVARAAEGMRSIRAVYSPALMPGGGSCSSSLYCAWIALCSTATGTYACLFDLDWEVGGGLSCSSGPSLRCSGMCKCCTVSRQCKLHHVQPLT